MRGPLKVWFLASEVAPFAKTGGLADVAGALPGGLRDLGVDVHVGLPFYRMAKEAGFKARQVMEGLQVQAGNAGLVGSVHETSSDKGVPVYLFDMPELFDRGGLYGETGGDYPDNLERFAYFCRAALIFAKKTGFKFDLVHCHDWQTGLVPVYLKTLYREDPFFSTASSVFTIHNMGYQGLFPAGKLSACGVPPAEFHADGIEYWGKISLLKAGIVYADAVTTVSPRYSVEIQGAELGMGMDKVLRKRSTDIHGILNGADYSVWDPATDRHLPENYSPGRMAGKKQCKASLIQEMGLDPAMEQRPLIGMISRLDHQKGLDLLMEILHDALKLDIALVILGSGDVKIETAVRRAAEQYPGRLGLKLGFDEPLAHRIMAGSDMILIPSRYEPCGLVQIYGLKYGTVPIVRATGGLDDTVAGFDPDTGKGTGFKFAEYEAGAFLGKVKEAVEVFGDKSRWKRLMRNGMQQDFSWQKSARRYLALYGSLAERRIGA